MAKIFKVENPKPGRKDIPMTGRRFGMLVVQSFSHLNKAKNKVWKCLCDCGNYAFITTTQLRQGKTTSCKCNQYKKGENVYNFTGYEDITGAKWYSIKHNAENRGLCFEITKKNVWDLFEAQNRKCKISGLPISFKANTASIDRINNSLGYTICNIQIVHKDVNLMRNKFELEYFITMCKLIASNFEDE